MLYFLYNNEDGEGTSDDADGDNGTEEVALEARAKSKSKQ